MEAGLGRWLNPWYQRTREWWITFDFFLPPFFYALCCSHFLALSLFHSLSYFIKTLSGGKCTNKIFPLPCYFSMKKRKERKCCFMLWHSTVLRKIMCVCVWERGREMGTSEWGRKRKIQFWDPKISLTMIMLCRTLCVCVCMFEELAHTWIISFHD